MTATTLEIRIAQQGAAPSLDNEIALLRRALERQPDSVPLLTKLSRLLNRLDRFGETIALLDGHVKDDIPLALALMRAHLFRQEVGDASRAEALADQMLTIANDDQTRAALLLERGRARGQMAGINAACADWRAALDADSGHHIAFERLARTYLLSGDAAAALDLCEELRRKNIAHSSLLAMHPLALLRLGRIEEARHGFNPQQDISETILPAPDGWNSAAAFHHQLSEEILTHPDLRGKRLGTSSVASQRVDDLTSGQHPALARLFAQIIAEVQRQIASPARSDAPHLANMPKQAQFGSQAVITGPEGHERWHMHSHGWLSGGYYPAVPERVSGGRDDAGCLIFGAPPELVGQSAADALGTRVTRPLPGMLALFPSYAWHSTQPHGDEAKRICIAFDIRAS